MEFVKFRMEKYLCLYNSMGLSSFGYRKYKYMVLNPLSCVWFGLGNSQSHFLLGLSVLGLYGKPIESRIHSYA